MDQDHDRPTCSSDEAVTVDQLEECDEDNLDEHSVSSSPLVDEDEHLEIVVKRVGKGDNDVLSLRLDPTKTVFDLKCQIQEITQKNKDLIPVERQRLVYFGRMLRDNEELLGSDGVKMKPEVTNYIHLSPLPDGATPSPVHGTPNRPEENFAGSVSFSPNFPIASEPSSSLAAGSNRETRERALERARRFGTASRERRRRRQDRPYNASDQTRNTQSSYSSEEFTTGDASRGSHPSRMGPNCQGRSSGVAADVRLEQTSESDGTRREALRLRAGVFPFPSISQTVLAPPSIFSSSVVSPPMTPATARTATATRVAHLLPLTATVPAASADSQARLLQQARAASLDLVPIFPVLEERLRQIVNGTLGVGLAPFGGNSGSAIAEVEDTIGLLEHVSREASSLALLLRSLPPESLSPAVTMTAAPALDSAALSVATAPLAAIATPVAFEQLVATTDPTILIPGVPPIFVPAPSSSWFPPTM